MKTTIAIKNYELTLPIGNTSTVNSMKIFTNSNNLRIKNIFVTFSAARNDRPLVQLLEETNTKVRNIRLLLGENDLQKFLDFLRNENNRHFIIVFDPGERPDFVTGRDVDTDIEGGPFGVYNLDLFALHSKAFNIIKRNQLSQVTTVFGR